MASRVPIKFTKKEACSIKGCPNFVWARQLCSRHYQADYRTRGPPCSRRGCENHAFARGLCVKHYQREYRQTGEPCRKRRCGNPAFSRGLCVKHYHQWYHRVLRENHSKSLKLVPRRAKIKAV